MRATLLIAMLFAGCRQTPAIGTSSAKVSTMDEKAKTVKLMDLHVPPRAPSPSGRAPALVVLHGFGSNEQDLVGLARAFDPRIDVHCLRAPIALGGGSFAWFNVTFAAGGPVHHPAEAETARAQLAGFLKQLRELPSIDPSRIHLLGFSQGAILGLSLAYTEPSLLAGVIAISGRTLPEIAATVPGRSFTRGPRVLLMHGTEDDRLPFANALASGQLLRTTGLAYEFKSYPVGHTIDARMRDDVAAWLSAQLGP
jgi:phospholipase/carboxylesterase